VGTPAIVVRVPPRLFCDDSVVEGVLVLRYLPHCHAPYETSMSRESLTYEKLHKELGKELKKPPEELTNSGSMKLMKS